MKTLQELEKLKMNFPDRFIKIMNDKGLIAKDVAKLAPVSVNQVYHWCDGTAEPNFLSLMKLANAFEISIDELVGLKEIGET